MKDDLVYVGHIADCIRKIEDYTKTGRAAFMADTMIQDAVMRNFGVIGEATRNISWNSRLHILKSIGDAPSPCATHSFTTTWGSIFPVSGTM